MNGYGKITFSDSTHYEGEWKNNKWEGLGTKVDCNGNVTKGNWADGKLVSNHEDRK
jgi:hypothetical protein